MQLYLEWSERKYHQLMIYCVNTTVKTKVNNIHGKHYFAKSYRNGVRGGVMIQTDTTSYRIRPACELYVYNRAWRSTWVGYLLALYQRRAGRVLQYSDARFIIEWFKGVIGLTGSLVDVFQNEQKVSLRHFSSNQRSHPMICEECYYGTHKTASGL